jgi:hypothetical protein
VKLTNHLHPVPRSKNTPSWRGAQLKHRDLLLLYLGDTEENHEEIQLVVHSVCSKRTTP